MHVERRGSGSRRFLALHGWSGDHTTFNPLLTLLPPDATLFTVDLPGCGQSPAPQEWQLGNVVRQITDVICDLADTDLTLLGNCSGGLLGLCAVRELVDKGKAATVRRIVLVDPLAYWPWYFRVFASDRIGKYSYATAFENPLGQWLVNACLAGKRQSETNLTKGFDVVPGSVALGYLRVLREIERPEEFAGLHMPIDIVHGDRTFEAVRKSILVFRRIWPQAEVTEVPDAGHLPLAEAPAAVAKVLFGASLCEAA